MIGTDKISDVAAAVNAQAVYNANSNTLPSNLLLLVLNQSQDLIALKRNWAKCLKTVKLTVDGNRQVALPGDCGMVNNVWEEPTLASDIPTVYYKLNSPEPSEMYAESVLIDSATGTVIKTFTFTEISNATTVNVEYYSVIPAITQEDIDGATKFSFFPIGVMTAAAKKVFQDYYGIAGNQDAGLVNVRFEEEVRLLSNYVNGNNVSSGLSAMDRYGFPVYIGGLSVNGNVMSNRITLSRSTMI